jgi:hypothetical protein
MAWNLLPYAPIKYPSYTQSLVAYSGYGSSEWVSHPLFIVPLIIAQFAAYLGMFLFLSWSRWLFVATVIATYIMGSFSGVSVVTPIDSFVGGLIGLSNGAIIALAFISPISDCWRKDV